MLTNARIAQYQLTAIRTLNPRFGRRLDYFIATSCASKDSGLLTAHHTLPLRLVVKGDDQPNNQPNPKRNDRQEKV